jgi:hypothetical protein
MAIAQEKSELASDTAFSPELQMANMLGLCEAQMDSALQESDKAVEALIQAFTNMVDTTRKVRALTDKLPPELKQSVAVDLDGQLEAMAKQVSSAVMAFQFYDKLTQRLGHVRYSLSTLAMFVCDRAQTSQPEQWQRLLSTLRRLYRTEEEHRLFLSLMDGIAEDAPGAAAAEEPNAGEIELF